MLPSSSIDYVTKLGDSQPPFEAVIVLPNNMPLNLTGVDNIKLRLYKLSTKITKELFPVNITDANKGKVSYIWQPGDFDTPGIYLAEFVLTYNGDQILTVPKSRYIVIKVINIL